MRGPSLPIGLCEFSVRVTRAHASTRRGSPDPTDSRLTVKPNYYLHITAERCQQAHERFHGKSLKIAPRQSRNIRLGQTKQDCRLDLFQSTLADDIVDPSDQTRLDEVSVRIR